jgi:O-antigen/teichoic acid export membrane protein
MQVTPDSSADPELSAPLAPAAVPGAAAGNQHGLVRNTLYLTLAQVVTIPISVAANALAGRYLGAEEFGYLYLASTLCAFAILPLEWGQQGSVPALVARDRPRAGVYLGTALVWRSLMAVLISGVLALICLALGYDRGVRWAVGLSFPLAVLTSFAAGFKDTIRGFERTDIPSIAHVAQQVVTLVVIAPVLFLGGHLRALVLANIVVAGLTVFYLRWASRPIGLGPLKYERSALKPLFSLGTPFVFFGLAMVLQPNINATFLSKLVPAQVIGWFGVSQRLVGLLIFPASALIGALYPTLCRLHQEDREEFVRVSRNSLYGVSLVAIPAAVGCGFFPELGVSIFGSSEFAGATDHLRLMSVFVFLVYLSMPLGTLILAAERQRAWTLVQCICLVVSLVGNPFLIPYFQRRMGNGAMGTCATLVISELLVVVCGIALSPRGVFDRQLYKSLLLAGLAGAAMAGVALLTKTISLFLAVPAALLAYGVVAWFSGAIQPSTIDMIKGFVGRRLSRAR